MSNTLSVEKTRVSTFTLDGVQNDNLTPLTITVASDLISTFGANPLLWVDFKLSDGTELYIGSFPLAATITTTIPNTVLACDGILYAQVRIKDDTGYEWHSYQSYQVLYESIADAEAATVDDRVYVETPATFTTGNLVSYSDASGRLVDLETTPQAIIQAYQDFLAMLGDSVATLTDGKLTASQIPALSINDTFPVASEAELLTLTAQRGDVGLIVAEDVVTDSYLLTADDPTDAANWVKLGVSYVANAGHANTADSATNSEKINNKRLIAMTQAEYDIAVLDPDTYYIVTP